MRFYLCLTLLLGLEIKLHACLLSEQVLKMQSEKLSSINGFLTGEGWHRSLALSDQEVIVFDYTLYYDKVVWSKYDQGEIELYYKAGKQSIVFYYPEASCYHSVLQQFSSKQKGEVSRNGNDLTTKFQKGNLTVQFEEGDIAYSGHPYTVLVFDEREVKKEISTAKEKIAKAERLRFERENEAESVTQQAGVYFDLGQFELAEQEYRKLAGLERVGVDQLYDFGSDSWVADKILECQFGVCNRSIQAAAESFSQKKYDDAIVNYQAAIVCCESPDFQGAKGDEIQRIHGKILEAQLAQKHDIGEEYFLSGNYDMALASFEEAAALSNNSIAFNTKLNDLRNRIKEARSNEYFAAADNYYNTKQYKKAIESYREVLKLNPNNKSATDKIAASENILDILHKRRTIVFKYADTNPMNYTSYKAEISGLLDSRTSSESLGLINAKASLSFDTLGINTSTTTIASSSTSGLDLNKILHNPKLSPPKLGDYFISSEDVEDIKVDWKTDFVEFNTKGTSIYGPTIPGVTSFCSDYLKSKPYCYGKTTFAVKTKTLNGKQSIDIGLSDYNPKGMPIAGLASLAIPGLGSVFVTHGETGWFNMASCLTLAGAAFAFENASSGNYSNYLDATTQDEMDNLYEKANQQHKVSLICASLAATIYVSDVVRAMNVGFKNLKNSRALRTEVKKNSFNLQYQPVKF